MAANNMVNPAVNPDLEDDLFAKEVEQVKTWWKDSRWRFTKRPFTAEQIVAKRGHLKIEYPSSVQAKKLWGILEGRFKVRAVFFYQNLSVVLRSWLFLRLLVSFPPVARYKHTHTHRLSASSSWMDRCRAMCASVNNNSASHRQPSPSPMPFCLLSLPPLHPLPPSMDMLLRESSSSLTDASSFSSHRTKMPRTRTAASSPPW